MGTMRWQPKWWNESYASAWDHVKEAMRRDWEQTKHDLHLRGGHELNQSVAHTVKQARGKEPIPPNDGLNPPKVVGAPLPWNDIELPVEYGYSARAHFGDDHTAWTAELESSLREEWEAGNAGSGLRWEDVRDHVKRGYEYRGLGRS